MHSSIKITFYLGFACAVLGLYVYYGQASYLAEYYSPAQMELRSNHKLLRPMYANLQRELVKSKLDLPFALDNLDLIIDFAAINSRLGQGLLPQDVKILLSGLLRAVPRQVTALNLLAIDSYNRGDFAAALVFWRKILLVANENGSNSEHVAILRQKIRETEEKIDQLESIPTKKANYLD